VRYSEERTGSLSIDILALGLLRVSSGGEIQQILSSYSGVDGCASLITRETVSSIVAEIRSWYPKSGINPHRYCHGVLA
jgi:hypothetical protein